MSATLGTRIIDGDGHIMEDNAAIIAHMEGAYREIAGRKGICFPPLDHLHAGRAVETPPQRDQRPPVGPKGWLEFLDDVGIDWTEEHRYTRMALRAGEWLVTAPLCETPYLTKQQIMDHAASEGLRIPRLYTLGFDHNNCGGMCVKMGQAHAAHALNVIPDVYLAWEREEQVFIDFIGKPVSILKDRRGGETKPPFALAHSRGRLSRGAGGRGGLCGLHPGLGATCHRQAAAAAGVRSEVPGRVAGAESLAAIARTAAGHACALGRRWRSPHRPRSPVCRAV